MRKMKAIVTGVAGFIGSHFANKLISEGHEVVGIDKFSPYYSRELKKMRLGSHVTRLAEFYELDLGDYKKVEDLVFKFKPDAIFHLAAQPGIRLPVTQNTQYINDNVIAFSNVLNIAIKFEIPNLIFASSSSVYGNRTSGELTESDIDVSPISFYGASKLINERMAESQLLNSKTRARGLRFFTVYGPWGRPDMAYFRLISSALAGTPFTLMGDGKVYRDFTYIDDVVDATYSLSEELSRRTSGYFDIVNVGGGSPFTLNQMITTIEKVVGKKIELEITEKHIGDVNFTCASTNLQLELIGKKPTTNLFQGISSTVDWMQKSEIQTQLKAWISSVRY